MSLITQFLTKENIAFTEDHPLSAMSTFRIGGVAKTVCCPDSTEKVSAAVSFCVENGIDYIPFGRCSNVLFPDEGVAALIIKTDKLDRCSFDGVRFCFGAGLPLCAAVKFAVSHKCTGMEFAYGIPGSVGGAVYMNAGAYGGEMAQCVVSAEYVDCAGNSNTVSELEFGKRRSFFTDKKHIITNVFVQLPEGDPLESEKLIEQYQNARREKQPLDMPSAGSVFKRPDGHFAGKLIEDCGLKGFSVGGAMVSEKHAGFIVNTGGATAKDVKELVSVIQRRVYEKYNVKLERELKYIGG